MDGGRAPSVCSTFRAGNRWPRGDEHHTSSFHHGARVCSESFSVIACSLCSHSPLRPQSQARECWLGPGCVGATTPKRQGGRKLAVYCVLLVSRPAIHRGLG